MAQLRRMQDEEIIERLTKVRGIGRWTVEMLLIFRLGRPDVLPTGDLAVVKGFSLVYGRKELPKPKELLHYGERWRPFRSVASWYLWRVHELPPETLQRIRVKS
jgi:DNA-3-methyladenine glycosylase II